MPCRLDSDGCWIEGTDKVSGVSRSHLVNRLLSRRYDGHYLGTPYSSGVRCQCMYLDGSPRWDGFADMNCTGFVAQACSCANGVGELGAIICHAGD
ncbi:MAG: hypothetical protein KH142_08395 [Slackia piriformis]|uniref:Uncharacterized protein n=1 Tax=Slackia piriformis TaxID=626934 RepID=A0A943UYN4_9ACTN|nr:hypothetical protein [Slackia piriformis]